MANKLCKDGRIWGQNNKEASEHLGISYSKKRIRRYSKIGEWNKNKAGTFKKGEVSKENHPNWKGGISGWSAMVYSSLEYKAWRIKIFERDNFTCAICKKVGGDLNSHHIKSKSEFPELIFDLNNGITLCKNCHLQVHSYLKKGVTYRKLHSNQSSQYL